jgi:hypothetical protein
MSYIILSGDMEMKDLNEIIEENKKANEIPKITKTKQRQEIIKILSNEKNVKTGFVSELEGLEVIVDELLHSSSVVRLQEQGYGKFYISSAVDEHKIRIVIYFK